MGLGTKASLSSCPARTAWQCQSPTNKTWPAAAEHTRASLCSASHWCSLNQVSVVVCVQVAEWCVLAQTFVRVCAADISPQRELHPHTACSTPLFSVHLVQNIHAHACTHTHTHLHTNAHKRSHTHTPHRRGGRILAGGGKVSALGVLLWRHGSLLCSLTLVQARTQKPC